MAQIIKHRRGSIGALKDVTANVGELVMATGSIGDLNAPVLFIGESAVAGGYKPVSKIYQGASAPTLGAAYGSTMDGTPFYSNNNKTLYILDRSGNIDMDLTGNIEGNTISGVTINNLQSTNVTASFVSGAFIGDATGLYNIPASGVTGLNLSKIYSGSVQVTTDSVTGDINIDATQNVNVTGSNLYLKGENETKIGRNDNSSYFYASGNYAEMYGNTGIDVYTNGGNLWVYNNSGQVHVSSYDGYSLELNTDGGEGNVNILNGGGNVLNIYGDAVMTGSLFATKIEGTGSLYLQPDQNDSRYFEIYNTSPTDTHIKASGGLSYFGDDINYLKIDDGAQIVTVNGVNGVNLYSNSGNINVSSYSGATLFLNTDGGEGDVHLGNHSNNVYGYTTITNFEASDYAQLGSNNSYVWVDADGAYIQQDGSSVVGFTARPNGTIEATGSLFVGGDVNIDGNTSVTGALVVANGSATFDQGLVAQNSNMLLTSGSNLIVQNSGNVQVDYLRGATNEYNYLSLNGNGIYGQPGVELSSTGDISLWAEGGTVNVTGSLRVTGDIIFSGSINLGDYSGDTVNFTGEISSSILPQTNNAFSLGSSGKTWSDVWATNAHFSNISLDTISFSGLTEGRVILGGNGGSLVDSGSLNFNNGQLGISGSIKLNDDAYIANDGALYITDHTNGVEIGSNNFARLASNSSIISVDSSGAYVEGNSYTQIKSNYGRVDISSYDGYQLRLNYDGGEGNIRMGNGDNSVQIYSHTYINNDKTLYGNRMWDNTDNTNYLELYGYGTNNSYWWESGSGADTTLNNNWNGANTNILNTGLGNVNIDAAQGSVNLHSNNGFNVTGSMIVSDGSGVFNSSLIVNNSDLTLDGGSNVHMNDGAHLYFGTCGDIYYDDNSGNMVFYNDCNNFSIRNNISVTGSMNVTSRIYAEGNVSTDNIYGLNNGNNGLRLNGGSLGASNVELVSSGQISLFSEGGGNDYAINMSGSVHIANSLDVSGSAYFTDHVYLNNNTTLYTNYISDYNGNNLNINTDGGLYLYSDVERYIQLSVNNAEDGTNYVHVTNDGVDFSTYDYSSGLTHRVFLDNTGSLNLENVNLRLTGSLGVSGSIDVTQNATIHGNLYVSGNVEFLSTASYVHISASQVDLGTNVINLNTYAPFERFAGINVYDSGSNAGVTGSLLWDSVNNVWLYANPSGSAYASARFIAGPQNSGSLGNETGLTAGHFPIAQSDDHIQDSLLTYIGTTLAFNTNKFTIDSTSGNTLIEGNVTLNATGGTDNGSLTSYVTFRNEDNILGFIDPTDTFDVTTQLLGYDSVDGTLKFSSLIDGGLY